MREDAPKACVCTDNRKGDAGPLFTRTCSFGVRIHEGRNPAGFSVLPGRQQVTWDPAFLGESLSTWWDRKPGWTEIPRGLDPDTPGVVVAAETLLRRCWSFILRSV